MELSEDEIIQNYGKKMVIVIEVHYYHTNMNLLASHVVTT